MMQWKQLIESYNNLVFIKASRGCILIKESKFALKGFEEKLKTIGKELEMEGVGNAGAFVYKFNASWMGFIISQRNEFFNS